jgi:hypothetical protein
MRYRIKIAESDFVALETAARAHMPKEAAVFALAGVARTDAGVDILLRRVVTVPVDEYVKQLTYHLEISTRAINGLAALCEANGLGAVLCHAHGNDSSYSPSDDFGEARVFAALRHFLAPDAPTASLLFNSDGMRGRVWLPGIRQPIEVDEVVVLGRWIRRIRGGQMEIPIESVFDRQVLAFGETGQRLISNARVAVIGTGGTGSPTAEQAVRMGVQDLLLIDPDEWDPTNVTRVYRTTRSLRTDGRKKVQRVADGLGEIYGPSPRALPDNVVLRSAARQLRDRDVIFLCTDDHWGRAVVNEVAHQYLIPTINLGMRIAAAGGRITHAVGVIDVLRPDNPCLWCTNALSAERIAAESMPASYRAAVAAEGYVEGVGTKTPSVITINTTISGQAATLFLQLLTDFMGEDGNVARINYDALTATMRRGRASVASPCVCRKVKGFGDLRPLSVVDALPE